MNSQSIFLPRREFLTIPELARRWNVDESEIHYLVETRALAIADKYAAMRGKRLTKFMATPLEFDSPEEKAFLGAFEQLLREHLGEKSPSSDEEVVYIDIPDSQIGYWDELMLRARDNLPEVSVPVVLMPDILEFEARQGFGKPLPRRERQIAEIIRVCKELGFPTLAIPSGGKQKIKSRCILSRGLFTDSGFDHAWKSALEKGLVKTENHEKYAKR